MSQTSAAVPATRAALSLDLAVLLACFLLSGLAALIYQTAWMRQFGLLFGTSELAVATVLAAYMAGLALGARLVESVLPRLTRLVRTYALLEAGIALSAVLLVPALLGACGWLLTQWFGGQAAPPSSDQVQLSFFYVLASFLVLLVPTTLMGATLPVLARHAVHHDEEIGRRIGLFYAVNTAGAVLGALLTAYWLLPALGLQGTTWVGAGINLLVFLLASAVVPQSGASGKQTAPAITARLPPMTWHVGDAPWILPLMLLSGAVSFFYEVLWTRLLSHLVGGSIHAFALMVGSFLAGIALGGAIGAALARDRVRATTLFVAAQMVIALAGAAAYFVLLSLAPYQGGLAPNSLLGFFLLLPMTTAIGITFPLGVRILAPGPDGAAAASARVYAWNTVGAIVGAIAGGFWLIPAFRYEGSIQFGVLASLVVALLALFLLAEPRRLVLGATGAALLAGAALLQPPRPDALLFASPLAIPSHGRLLHYDVGRSASVVVLAQDGGLALRTNGLPEALMDTVGQAPRFSGEFWMAPLASILRPEARDMLVIGYGGGVVVEGIAPSIRQFDVIELESKVIEANRATSGLRRRDPLGDARMNLVVNDARGALQLTSRQYDVIVSQPSHPWTAGASHLYTLEFMQLAQEHLRTSGLFIQWMNVNFLNEDLLRSLTATLRAAFGQVRIYRADPFTLVFVASSGNLAPERRLLASGVPLSLAPAHYARYGISSAEDLVYALAVDEAGAERLAAGAPLITDDRNRIATSTVFNQGAGLSAEAAGRLLAAYDPLQNRDSWIYRELRDRLSFQYIVRRNTQYISLDRSLVDRSRRIVAALGRSADARLGEWYLRAALEGTEQARELAVENAKLAPTDANTLFVALQPAVAALKGAPPPAELAAAMVALPASARAALLGPGLVERDDFAQLSALDSILAQSGWTDTWRADSTLLRAEWRSRVSNPDQKRRFADEALDMLERDLIFTPSPATYGLRLRAALSADRPAVALETIDSLATWDLALLQRPGARLSRDRMRARLQQLQPVLEQIAKDPRVDAARAEEVRAKLRDAQERANRAS